MEVSASCGNVKEKIMKPFKPQLACDWIEANVKFPCIVQPKIDGVHSLNRDGKCTGRSLKAHANPHTTVVFSQPEYHGFCGEKTQGTDPTRDSLCRDTSSVLGREYGEPEITWWLFDYVTNTIIDLGYRDRMQILLDVVVNLPDKLSKNIRIIKSKLVNNMEELLAFEDNCLNEGYEGIIIRDPEAKYKYGRCGKTHMGAWRVKRFIDAEILVDELEEGNTNNNEAKTNELGRTERSSHKENKTGNGTVGNMSGKLLKDVLDPQTGAVILHKGDRVKVSQGKMTAEQKKYYWEHQEELLEHVIKFKLFPKGTKDKPRFPTFDSIRNKNDL